MLSRTGRSPHYRVYKLRNTQLCQCSTAVHKLGLVSNVQLYRSDVRPEPPLPVLVLLVSPHPPLPGLVNSLPCQVQAALLLLLVIEMCWNTEPSTDCAQQHLSSHLSPGAPGRTCLYTSTLYVYTYDKIS